MTAGRPTVYTDEIGHYICEQLVEGRSLKSICSDEQTPHRATVMRWLMSDDPQYKKFCDNYAKAREIQYQLMADDILDIADDGRNDYIEYLDENDQVAYKVNGEVVGRSRLRVDTRKWFMSKVLPKFADKPVLTPEIHVHNIMPVPTSDSVESWELEAERLHNGL